MAPVKITPSQEELELYQKFFNEAAFMGGTQVKYYAVKKAAITGTSSEVYDWEDPIEVDGIYEQRPKVSLLKKLNWFTEDEKNQPSILILPLKQKDKTITVKRGSLIDVPSAMNPQEINTFQVSDVRTDIIPLSFMCNLVPYRKPEDKLSEPTTNNVWLKT